MPGGHLNRRLMGGACRILYQLQALFSGADSGAIADAGDVETASSGSVEDGTLTVSDSDATAGRQAEVLSNKLKSTSFTVNTVGVYSQSIPRIRGQVLRATMNVPTTNLLSYMGVASSGSIAASATDYRMAMNSTQQNFYSLSSGSTLYQYAGDTTSNYTPANDRKLAIVLGGYDSNREPTADGVYGCHSFYNDSGTWRLFTSYAGYNTDPVHLTFQSQHGGASYGTSWDEVLAPKAAHARTNVFEPVGYRKDLFNDTNGTLITAHTMDSGESWTTPLGGTTAIQSNILECSNTAGAGAVALTTYSEAEYEMRAVVDCTTYSTAGGYVGFVLRWVDSSNFWYTIYDPGTSQFQIYEITGGGSFLRTFGINAQNAPFTMRSTIEGTGSSARLILSWNGYTAAKSGSVVYAIGTTHSAGTDAGLIWVRRASGAPLPGGTSKFQNFQIMPLTSSTYAELDLAEC